MKILVTGATGFLGGRACEILGKEGHEIVGIGRNLSKIPQGVSFVQADLTKPLPETVWQDVDAVVHCAAKSSAWGKYSDFYRNNVIATKLLAKQALKYGIKRFVHISSTSVYFDFKDHSNIKEDMILPVTKVNHYATTKYLAEQEILQASKQGLNAIILRPRAIFGLGDTALLPRLLKANNTRFFPESSKIGGPLTDITYVDNVVEAIKCALIVDNKYSGQVYNITNDEHILLQKTVYKLITGLGYKYKGKRLPFALVKTYAYLLEKFYQVFLPKQEPPFTVYSVGLISKDQTFNIDKAKKELGYKPKITIEQGLQYVIKNWKY